MGKWVEIRRHNGRRKLHVDGKPYLALGIQYNFQNSGTIKGFDYLFEHTPRLGCNTVFYGLTWTVLEPREGRYDWRNLDHAISRCRKLGLRMSMLWFGSKHGETCFWAPEWVKNDRVRFPRQVDHEGNEMDGLCWNNPELLALEKKAFDATLRHLAKFDRRDHTVILIQMLNEPCWEMFIRRKGSYRELDQWIERCMCARCTAAKERSGLTDWEFGVKEEIRHLNSLLKGQKRIFPALTYVNFAINPIRPGGDVERFLEGVPGLDFVAPDFYGYQQGDLGFTMRHFSRGRNLPFMAECATEKVGESDRNLWLCLLEHGAQGFDPWAIDHAFGWRIVRDQVVEPPPVSPDGKWSDMAVKFGRAQRALNHAHLQIARAIGSEDIMHYISQGAPLRLEERRWGLFWRFENGPDARWAVVRTGKDDLTVTGTDCTVTAVPLDPRMGMLVEGGRWNGEKWAGTGRVRPRILPRGFRKNPLDDRQLTYEMDLGDGRAFRIRMGKGLR